MEEVILELNLALRDDPESGETCRRLAEIYLDQGQPLKAAHVWGALLKRRPQDPQPYQELGRALEEAGEFVKARQVYQAGLERTGASLFQDHLKFLEEPREPPAEPPPAAPLLPQAHHLVAFLGLFAGREGVYARQWVSPTGESGYTPIQEPWTPKVAENHILATSPRGSIPCGWTAVPGRRDPGPHRPHGGLPPVPEPPPGLCQAPPPAPGNPGPPSAL